MIEAKRFEPEQRERKVQREGIASVLKGVTARRGIAVPDCYYITCRTCPARMTDSRCFWLVSLGTYEASEIQGQAEELRIPSLSELYQDLYYKELFPEITAEGVQALDAAVIDVATDNEVEEEDELW